MLTRKRQKALNLMLEEQRMTLQNDIDALHKQFEPRGRPAPKKRVQKELIKKSRINQKI
jgi:hypothetical protein